MAKVIFKNGAKDVTIEKCIELYESGANFYFQDGTDVVFEVYSA